MKSNSSRGRSIANDTSVQTLFLNITAMHSRLLRCIQKQDDQRGKLAIFSKILYLEKTKNRMELYLFGAFTN